MKKKRLFTRMTAAVLILVLVAALCACGAVPTTPAPSPAAEPEAAAEPAPTKAPAAKAETETPALPTVDASPETMGDAYYYGTWKIAGISNANKAIGIDEFTAGGKNESVKEAALVLTEEGKFSFVDQTGEWQSSDTGIEFGGLKLPLIGNCLFMPVSGEGVLFILCKASDSQEIEEPAETEEPKEEPAEAESADASGLRPEFKEAMDAYEAFYDEYCEFMKEYQENPTNIALLTKYTQMLSQLTEMNASFEKWNSGDLNSEELKYYTEVNARVLQKMADIY